MYISSSYRVREKEKKGEREEGEEMSVEGLFKLGTPLKNSWRNQHSGSLQGHRERKIPNTQAFEWINTRWRGTYIMCKMRRMKKIKRSRQTDKSKWKKKMEKYKALLSEIFINTSVEITHKYTRYFAKCCSCKVSYTNSWCFTSKIISSTVGAK